MLIGTTSDQRTTFLSGIFPTTWKSVFVQPIFKDGDHYNIKNYCPISIFSSFASIFDAAITHHLFNFITDKVISEHGFIKNKSTLSNLILFTSFITNAFTVNSQVTAIYTDYSKAFDTVNHEILIQKLSSFGMNNNYLNWFSDFLDNRFMSVRINNTSATYFHLT